MKGSHLWSRKQSSTKRPDWNSHSQQPDLRVELGKGCHLDLTMKGEVKAWTKCNNIVKISSKRRVVCWIWERKGEFQAWTKCNNNLANVKLAASMNWSFCLGLTWTSDYRLFQWLYHIMCTVWAYIYLMRIWFRWICVSSLKPCELKTQDLCKQDPESICKVGKYNFPSSNAFVGVKQTTIVGFVDFTPFLQTYCHTVQCLSLMKHWRRKFESSLHKMLPRANRHVSERTIFFSQFPHSIQLQAIFPLKRDFPHKVSVRKLSKAICSLFSS